MLTTIAIIPARYNSTRFEGKPLANICGKSMIRRVYENVAKSSTISEVFVATDDKRIEEHVRGFGGRVCMTSTKLTNGTQRCYAAYTDFIEKELKADIIVNIQGDEPLIDVNAVDSLVKCLQERGDGIATLIKRIESCEELFDSNVVKVVKTLDDKALYFSRQPIPFIREQTTERWIDEGVFYKHIGMYAYSTYILKKLVYLPESILENSEKLEQLRWLENALTIYTKETNYESVSVDTPQDIKKIEKILEI